MNDQTSNELHNFERGDTSFISSTAGTKRALLPGDIVDGSYQLTAVLGHGGMGVVFACHHKALGKNYALKLLNGDQLSGEYWSRFQAEAKALAKLNHPGIVGVHNMGIDGGQYPYYVMDLLSGESLDMLIRKSGGLSVSETLDLFIQISDALSCAHSQGIIHRDIKPSNLMVVRDEYNDISAIKLVDFGIARLSNQAFAAQSQTATGLVFGTPFYMSPEQCSGIRVDERSDIYSLGCALFETLTGRPPFCGENAFDTFMLHQTKEAPTLTSVAPKRRFPDAVEALVAKMLAKRPAQRYQTMGQVRQDLERIKAGKAILSEGLGTTIAPDRGKIGALPRGQYNNQKIADQEVTEEDNRRGPSAAKIAACATALLLLGVGGAYWALKPSLLKSKTELTSSLLDTGTDVGGFMDPRATDLGDNEERMKPLLNKYMANCSAHHSYFKTSSGPAGYNFPTNFILAAISVDNQAPHLASGFVAAPAGQPVRVYLHTYTRTWIDILDKFGPDDLTGLEVLTNNVELTIQKLKHWHKLSELSFFDSLTKALPHNEPKYDETQLENRHLPLIDQLSNLRSLGLCGQKVNGRAVMRMHLLDQLHTLKLKRIINIGPLLEYLTTKDNITELWLVGEDIKDDELEPLTRMKHLETLRIRRSNLTAASLDYFKRMKALKHLTLDRDFAPSAVQEFKTAIADFRFEPVVDFEFWQMLPDEKKKH